MDKGRFIRPDVISSHHAKGGAEAPPFPPNVSYHYNATCDFVSMTDWHGTTTFELDLLHHLTAASDHKGNRVEYTYDGVGNQTSIAYPDGTTAAYAYDLVSNQTKVSNAAIIDNAVDELAQDAVKELEKELKKAMKKRLLENFATIQP